jgi:hypothetical protein
VWGLPGLNGSKIKSKEENMCKPGLLKQIKWFWFESKKYTGYNGLKLLLLGFIPCIKFLFYMRHTVFVVNHGA